jgi:pyruvate carboxylase
MIQGTEGPTALDQAISFFDSLPPGSGVMIKAVAGGGGRGMRAVQRREEIPDAYQRCRSEAAAAFGIDEVYVEQLVPTARHVEIQVIGDGKGTIQHLWERDCSLQRRHQKVIELAPAPNLNPDLRDRAIASSLKMAKLMKLRSLATFEFLVDKDARQVYFMEVNPRLQVEHTVTESITGIDLVRLQMDLARGSTLSQLGFGRPLPPPKLFSMQIRVNAERMGPNGLVFPSAGTLRAFDPPVGLGVRVDTCGYVGYTVSPLYDSLLAKVVVTGASFSDVLALARRALAEFRIEGVDCNLDFLASVLDHERISDYSVSTKFIEDNMFADPPVVPLGREMLHFQSPSSSPLDGTGVATLRGPPDCNAVTAALDGTVK